MHYGAPTAKRERGFSNNAALHGVDKGTLPRSVMIAQTKHKLAETGVTASGKKKWTGVRKTLKESQPGS